MYTADNMGGHIREHRGVLFSDLWKMDPLYHRVFAYLRLTAQYAPYLFPTGGPFGIWVLPGQRITSVRQIAEGVKWTCRGRDVVPNVKTISRVLEWLSRHGLITQESNATGTFIAIINWHTYNGSMVEKVTPKKKAKVTRRGQPGQHVADDLGNTSRTQVDKDYKKKKEDKEKYPPQNRSGGGTTTFFLGYWKIVTANLIHHDESQYQAFGYRPFQDLGCFMPTRRERLMVDHLLDDISFERLILRAAYYFLDLQWKSGISNPFALFCTRVSGLPEIDDGDMGDAADFGILPKSGVAGLKKWIEEATA